MRGPPVCLRALTAEERSAVEALARSRTAPARRVERARVIWRADRGETPPAIAAALGVDAETVRRRIRRFDAEGLAALEDHPRPGRPATYSPGEVAAVIAAALTAPRSLGLPFASWTLDRLAAYLLEHKGVAMRRSRIDAILPAEGLRWRRHQTWFGARVDPGFAGKRAASRRSTPARRRAASWSAPTRWARSAPRATRGGTWFGHDHHPRAGLDRRSTTAGAARATSSAPSVPRDRRRVHPALSRPRHQQLGDVPGPGRGLGAGGGRAGLRHRRQPGQPPRPRRAAVHAGASALRDGVPAEIRRLPQPDRAVMEGAALLRPSGTPLRDLGRGLRGGRSGHGVLERTSPSPPLGTKAPPSTAPPARHRAAAQGRMTCRMNHLGSDAE
jgi:transposase